MKKTNLLFAVSILIFVCVFLIQLLAADQSAGQPHFEYVTVRWQGRDNTHVVRPGGQMEFIGHEFRKAAKPDRADERAFYMNLAMNGLTKEGFEFAGMTDDIIVMKRLVSP